MSELHGTERPVRIVGDTPREITRAATWLSWSLALAGVALFVVLLATGGGLPPLLPTLLLGAVLAVCVNRVALYPNDIAATAELAVFLCAVVAFRDVAPVTGPLLLALAVGMLDASHWRRRSFVRMAYNSGNRTLVTVGAAGTFAAGTAMFGTTTAGWVAATVLASGAAALLDGLATVALVRSLGGSARAARRELLDIDALALPLAVAGGAIGFVAIEVGWWAAAVPLALLALVPELLQARARIPARFARDLLLAIELVAMLVVVARYVPVPSLATVVVLGVLAIVVGTDLVADARVPVPPVLAVVVVALVTTTGAHSAVFAGMLVGGLATATAWWAGDGHGRATAILGVGLAACAGAAAAAPIAMRDGDPATVWLVVAASFAIFTAFAAVGTRSVRPAVLLDQCWSVPLLGGAVAAGVIPALTASPAAALAGAALLGSALLGAWCGSVPWRSRFLSARFTDVRGGGRTVVLLGLCGVAGVMGLVGLLRQSVVAPAFAAAMLACGGAALTMGAWAVRQWVLGPVARRRLCWLLTLAVVAWCASTSLVLAGRVGLACALAVVAAITSAWAGRGSVGTADRVG
ncbi:MAG: hypothetical protein U0W40_00350 [Acidimicrobiia bacterium]